MPAEQGGTIAVAAHPGGSDTELMRNSPTPVRQVFNLFAARFGQSAAPDGFREVRGHPKLVASSRRSHDAALQRRLWALSEELTGITFPV
ncbi:hypothetical protein [Spirillospora sp. NPDC047279]|uniref:hypothetical protein n=1 Tax=Spirillospora sp. NPDC047279 TaxID=3155478 RepID=UPI0033DDBF20